MHRWSGDAIDIDPLQTHPLPILQKNEKNTFSGLKKTQHFTDSLEE
jgi:hypothetical protein